MSAEAEEFADRIARQHVDWFKEHPDRQLVQTNLFETEDGGRGIIPCQLSSCDEREVTIKALRDFMARVKVVRYALWAECWVRGVRLDEAAPYRHGEAAEDPDRQEVVTTVVVEQDGTVTSRSQKIERGPDGNVVALHLEPKAGRMMFGGAMISLMPIKPKVH